MTESAQTRPQIGPPYRDPRRLTVPVCLAYLFLLVTVFGPFAVWHTNQAELTSSFSELLPHLVAWKPGIGLLAVGLLAAFLPFRFTRLPACLIFSLLVFGIVEFSFFRGESELIGNVGVGIQVDTTGLPLRILVFAVIFALAFFLREKLHRIAITTLACMTLAGLVQIAAASWSRPAAAVSTSEEAGTSSAYLDFFTFSSENNIIHIVLDELQYSFFEKVARSEFPDYESTLDGFVYYRNHLGSYPNTHHSMYSLFQDTVFYNDVPTPEWIAGMADYTIFDDLVSAGVRVDFMTHMALLEVRDRGGVNYNKIPLPYADFVSVSGGNVVLGSTGLEARLIRDVTLGRLTPDPLHRLSIAPPEAERAPGPIDPGSRSDAARAAEAPAQGPGPPAGDYLLQRLVSSAEIIRDLGRHSRVGTEGTVYKQLYSLVTHNPAGLNADCSTREKTLPATWENMYPQTTCALRLLFQFLDRLKEIGVYDNSTIIIHADHGKRNAFRAGAHLEEFVFGAVQEPPKYHLAFSRVISSAMPILLAKRRNARHRLRVSNAPTSFADIASTIKQLANVPLRQGGRSIFDIEEDEDRQRQFFYYHYPNRTDPYLDRLVEYRVQGRTWDPAAWREAAVYLGPHSDFRNERIDMGAAEFRHHERDWWLQGTDSRDRTLTIAYTIGPFSEIGVQFPDRADRTMTVRMKSMVADQVLDVAVNGRNIGAITFAERGPYEEYELGLPGEYLRESPEETNVIAFRPRRMTAAWNPGAQRIRYGVGIDWIAFDAS